MDFSADVSLLYADFGVSVVHQPTGGGGSTTALALLDEPGTALVGGEFLATDYSLRFPATNFPAVKRGDSFTVGSRIFTAREAAQPEGLDGLEMIVPLARVS